VVALGFMSRAKLLPLGSTINTIAPMVRRDLNFKCISLKSWINDC